MRLRRFRTSIADDWTYWAKFQYVFERDITLAPLKDKDAVRLENSQALAETFDQVLAPCVTIQAAVIVASPAALADKMRRVKDDEVKTFVQER